MLMVQVTVLARSALPLGNHEIPFVLLPKKQLDYRFEQWNLGFQNLAISSFYGHLMFPLCLGSISCVSLT